MGAKRKILLTSAVIFIACCFAGCASIPDKDHDELSVQAAPSSGRQDRQLDRLKWKAAGIGTTAAITTAGFLLSGVTDGPSLELAAGAGALLGLSYASLNQVGGGSGDYARGYLGGVAAGIAATIVFMAKNPQRYNDENKGSPVAIYTVDALAGLMVSSAVGGVFGELWDFINGLF